MKIITTIEICSMQFYFRYDDGTACGSLFLSFSLSLTLSLSQSIFSPKN